VARHRAGEARRGCSGVNAVARAARAVAEGAAIRRYGGEESARTAVVAKLGDTEAFRMVIRGEDVIRRKDAEFKIDAIIQDWASNDEGKASLGTIGGMPIGHVKSSRVTSN
jgi:hypothetical protein